MSINKIYIGHSSRFQKKKKKKKNISYFLMKTCCGYSLMKTCCGYSLEVPHRGTSNEYPQHIFSLKSKTNMLSHLNEMITHKQFR